MEESFEISYGAERLLAILAKIIFIFGILAGLIIIMASLSDTGSSNPYYHGESYDSVIGLIIGITTIIGSITTFAFIHVIINISNNLKNINKVLSEKNKTED